MLAKKLTCLHRYKTTVLKNLFSHSCPQKLMWGGGIDAFLRLHYYFVKEPPKGEGGLQGGGEGGGEGELEG